MAGWVVFDRDFTKSALWLQEPFTRGQAWVDLFANANHSDGYFRVNGHRVDVKRGQIGWSQLTMKDRWKWSRGKVNRFIKELEKDGNVVQETGQYTTVLTICNYNKYQNHVKHGGTVDGTTDGTVAVQLQDNERDTNNNVNNENHENNENKTTLFDDFWKIYPGPRKNNKPKAKTLFNKQNKATQELIINHIRHRSLNDPEWTKEDGKFIPGPVTFLNQNRWTDEYRVNDLAGFGEKTQQSIRNVQEYLDEHPDSG